MKLPLHLAFEGMEASEAVEAAAREKAAKLDQFFPQIMSCRVVVSLEQKHKHQGHPYAVRIDLTVPGHELVVDRVRHEDVYVALREAFDDMKRRLEDVARKMHGQVKHHTEPLAGEVIRMDAEGRYAFIRSEDGVEYYFGPDNMAGQSFDAIAIGTPVQFLPDIAGEGMQAKRVTVTRPRQG